MKTAEDIVRALAACDEPLEEGYDTCAMPECGALRVDHGPERPIEEHRPDCPYRMAREWVEANPPGIGIVDAGAPAGPGENPLAVAMAALTPEARAEVIADHNARG